MLKLPFQKGKHNMKKGAKQVKAYMPFACHLVICETFGMGFSFWQGQSVSERLRDKALLGVKL